MLQNNQQRLRIWQNLNNKLSYREMTEQCLQAAIPLLSPLEFAHKVGMLMVAADMYPGLSQEEAYTKLVTAYGSATPAGLPGGMEMTTETVTLPDGTTQVISKPRGCCGGSQVK